MQCRTACETAEESLVTKKTDSPGEDQRSEIQRCMELLENTVEGFDVLIKPNFNTSDPAQTQPITTP